MARHGHASPLLHPTSASANRWRLNWRRASSRLSSNPQQSLIFARGYYSFDRKPEAYRMMQKVSHAQHFAPVPDLGMMAVQPDAATLPLRFG